MPIKPVKELVAEAKARIESIPVAEALALHGRDDVLFVDIRDIRELEREGRIPGAFHAPRGMLEFWVDPASAYHKPPLADGRKLVLYCASSWRSALAAAVLMDMGHPAVAELEGGITAWRDAGGPIEQHGKSR